MDLIVDTVVLVDVLESFVKIIVEITFSKGY